MFAVLFREINVFLCLNIGKYMYRTKIKELNQWRLSNHRKPLIFLGARQVGKTYLLREFGRTEYKQVAYVNFERPGAPKNLFEVDFNADRIFTVLNAYCNIKIEAENTLIIFDEIQAAPKGITSLKYLYEDSPQYHILFWVSEFTWMNGFLSVKLIS